MMVGWFAAFIWCGVRGAHRLMFGIDGQVEKAGERGTAGWEGAGGRWELEPMDDGDPAGRQGRNVPTKGIVFFRGRENSYVRRGGGEAKTKVYFIGEIIGAGGTVDGWEERRPGIPSGEGTPGILNFN